MTTEVLEALPVVETTLPGVDTDAPDWPSTISVTADHLVRGKPRSITQCAVSLAIRDALPWATMVTFHTEGGIAAIWKDTGEHDYRSATGWNLILGLAGEAYAKAFDARKSLSPRTFPVLEITAMESHQ